MAAPTTTFTTVTKPKEAPVVQEVKLDYDQLLRQKFTKRTAFNELNQQLSTSYISNPPLEDLQGRVLNWQLIN